MIELGNVVVDERREKRPSWTMSFSTNNADSYEIVHCRRRRTARKETQLDSVVGWMSVSDGARDKNGPT